LKGKRAVFDRRGLRQHRGDTPVDSTSEVLEARGPQPFQSSLR